MSAKQALLALKKQNDNLIEMRLQTLTSGSGISDFLEYKDVRGQLRGLQLANENLESLLRQIEKDDDE